MKPDTEQRLLKSDIIMYLCSQESAKHIFSEEKKYIGKYYSIQLVQITLNMTEIAKKDIMKFLLRINLYFHSVKIYQTIGFM